ncbi:MAG: arginine--tRNA ligase [Fimbriimonadaceae bacterium]
MLRSFLADLLRAAVASLVGQGKLPETARAVEVEIQDTKQPEHGDFACNFALVAAKSSGMTPRSIAEMLQAELLTSPSPAPGERGLGGEGSNPVFAGVDVAGPGFLNLRLDPSFIASYVQLILELGSRLPNTQHRNTETPQRLNVEFVSVNPNGPITVGSGRGAAFGDTLCRVFGTAGHDVYREYYVNDGVNSEQMRLFAESVRASLLGRPVPENGYKGEYVERAAIAIRRILFEQLKSNLRNARHILAKLDDPNSPASQVGFGKVAQQRQVAIWEAIDKKVDLHGESKEAELIIKLTAEELQDLAVWGMTQEQSRTLEDFGVDFDCWFSEQTLHDEGKVAAAIEKLKANGAADNEPYRMETPRDDPERGLVKVEQPPGAVWLRSTRFGDDQDRVLIREDGRPAYIAADVAYLESKLGERGFDKAYMILGPDHHGYIGRIYAMYEALGYPMKDGKPERLEIVIFQIVRFVKDGKPAPMRKRDGNIYELKDLINELGAAVAPKASEEERQRIGKDVARFFYLMRSHETHMDFDIDLATKQSEENPVFYAQYAHARICSVIRKAEEAGVAVGGQHRDTLTPQHLTHPKELALIKKIVDLPYEVQRCAEDYGVHRLTTYAVDLARTYHLFYDACRVIQPDQPELTQARLALCEAARIGLKAAFDLLGISAPERMEREATTDAVAHEGTP